MMADYVDRHNDLTLAGIVRELYELSDTLANTKPDIILLDLIIPQGAPSDFHFGIIPPTIMVIVVSAIPSHSYTGILPTTIAAELLKPVSYEHFADCIDQQIENNKS